MGAYFPILHDVDGAYTHMAERERDREYHKGLLDKVLDHFVNARQRRILSLWREGRELFKNFIHTNSTLRATRKSRMWGILSA